MGLINPGGNPSNTFSSGVYADNIYERTVDNGVSIDGLVVKNGIPTLAPADPTLVNDGDIAYDATTKNLKVRTSGSTKNVAVNTTPGIKGAFGGPAPVYNDSNSIILKAGTRAQDSLSFTSIEITSDLTVSLGVNGAAGLDTGTEAVNTWYYLYLIRKASDGTCSAVFSAVNESVTGSITLPSGFTQKRQLPFAVRNNASSNIIPFFVSVGWPYRPKIKYKSTFELGGTNGGTTVLAGGTATTYTTTSIATLVPPISREADFWVAGSVGGNSYIAETGNNTVNYQNVKFAGNNEVAGVYTMAVNSSGQIDYKTNTAALWLAVYGYTVTEVN